MGHEEYNILSTPFSESEVYSTLKNLKSKAKSLSGLSPFILNSFKNYFTPILTRTFNICLSSSSFPKSWLESLIFFIHKKSNRNDPNNYRSIAIQNPFLKAFSSLLCKRISKFASLKNILPTFQFGFRPNHSTTAAAALLYEVAHQQLMAKKKLFVCFVDFSKAFDSVDRSMLLIKLQSVGFPFSFCQLLHFILKNINSRIKSSNSISSPFQCSKGVPQGDPSSPLLFNLFLSDLPDHLTHQAPSLNNTIIQYIQYADDLALIADSPNQLQIAIDDLAQYCTTNNLVINTAKTKIMIFQKGRFPGCSFSLNSSTLERVSEFKYLGFTFTPQLSFTKHANYLSAKAKSRCALLFSKLPVNYLSLPVVKAIFDVFILPIFHYGLPLWINSCSSSSQKTINAVYTRFLKRYLGLPMFSNNAIVHHITDTAPLALKLKYQAPALLSSFKFPSCLSGHKLSFTPIDHDYNLLITALSSIPTFFWRSRMFDSLPTDPM